MKNKKSLGQIAFEKSYYKNNPWMDQVSESKYYWNRIAKAVAKEVRRRMKKGRR